LEVDHIESFRSLDSMPGKQENGRMKTTVDLPEALVREIELRAEHKRQPLQHAVEELLWKGLAASAEASAPLARPIVKTHSKTGLPYIECLHGASAEEEMTPERVADLLLQQEVAWHHEAG
jgi:hypothetical protein